MKKLTHLSLFSGIGGADIAAEWAGFKTVGQCEWADYPTKVLEKHWPDVPRWRDIRTLAKEGFYERTGLRTVDLVSGGFPCQPFSTAGKRRGKEDDRFLWPEMLRIIEELRPAWVVGENVAGLVTLALDDVLSDLEAKGYACRTFMVPACGVDAKHRRNRVAIVAHSGSRGFCKQDICNEQQGRTETFCTSKNVAYSNGEQANIELRGCKQYGRQPRESVETGEETVRQTNGKTSDNYPTRFREDVTDAASGRRQRERLGREQVTEDHERKSLPVCDCSNIGFWPTEPDVGRVANGVPSRVDRLKCLGNAIVPQQFYPVFKAIAEIETEVINCMEG